MTRTITTNLDYWIYQFITQQSLANNTTKRAIIEEAVKFYKKQLLKQQVKVWLEERYDEYTSLNNELSQAQFTSLRD
jgi:hypothetical protein